MFVVKLDTGESASEAFARLRLEHEYEFGGKSNTIAAKTGYKNAGSASSSSDAWKLAETLAPTEWRHALAGCVSYPGGFVFFGRTPHEV